MPQLKEGDSVRFKKPGDKHLSHAVVTSKHQTPRLFTTTNKTGREYPGLKITAGHRTIENLSTDDGDAMDDAQQKMALNFTL